MFNKVDHISITVLIREDKGTVHKQQFKLNPEVPIYLEDGKPTNVDDFIVEMVEKPKSKLLESEK